jgi:hypothetical protein
MLCLLFDVALTWINDVTPFYAINIPKIKLVLLSLLIG